MLFLLHLPNTVNVVFLEAAKTLVVARHVNVPLSGLVLFMIVSMLIVAGCPSENATCLSFTSTLPVCDEELSVEPVDRVQTIAGAGFAEALHTNSTRPGKVMFCDGMKPIRGATAQQKETQGCIKRG